MILVASLPMDRQLHAVGDNVSKRHGFGMGRPEWLPPLATARSSPTLITVQNGGGQSNSRCEQRPASRRQSRQAPQ